MNYDTIDLPNYTLFYNYNSNSFVQFMHVYVTFVSLFLIMSIY